MKRHFTLYVFLFLTLSQLIACTTAIISGKYTYDGRPLLFKQRDTGSLENKIMAFSDGKYDYVGLVNTKDTLGSEVWGGHNSTGFAIMNSASYNLNPAGEKDRDEREGIIMKRALQSCATIADFENLLESLPKPMFLSANFGVIDAQGGAAYYETGDFSYIKFDANDSNIAPMGYLIRTNFSFSGNRKEDKGLSRFQAASSLFYQAALSNNLSYDFILTDMSRSLTHGITGVDLYNQIPLNGEKQKFTPFRDFIPRYSTASAIVVQGVKEKESPAFTTMWTILGSPLTSVAIPVWVTEEKHLPTILSADQTGKAELCNWSLTLKHQLFSIENGEGPDYINLAALISADGEGILQKTKPIEAKIRFEAESKLQAWRKDNNTKNTNIKQFYDWIDQFTKKAYSETFPDIKYVSQ